MSIDNLTIGEAKQLVAMFGGQTAAALASREIIGQLSRPVIVRSRDAGVLFGDYDGNNGSTIHLKNARQLWKWRAAQGGTLIDVATYGVAKSGNRFSPAQSTVTVFNACALIDCTDIAAKSIIKAEGEKWA